mmetsp:Transcript_100442/g.319037  ORF Transcript_100442/g.319037 Transcript_100442/m.319037 type:complete len:321 (+) Transcript_100442:768-1730(+)
MRRAPPPDSRGPPGSERADGLHRARVQLVRQQPVGLPRRGPRRLLVVPLRAVWLVRVHALGPRPARMPEALPTRRRRVHPRSRGCEEVAREDPRAQFLPGGPLSSLPGGVGGAGGSGGLLRRAEAGRPLRRPLQRRRRRLAPGRGGARPLRASEPGPLGEAPAARLSGGRQAGGAIGGAAASGSSDGPDAGAMEDAPRLSSARARVGGLGGRQAAASGAARGRPDAAPPGHVGRHLPRLLPPGLRSHRDGLPPVGELRGLCRRAGPAVGLPPRRGPGRQPCGGAGLAGGVWHGPERCLVAEHDALCPRAVIGLRVLAAQR